MHTNVILTNKRRTHAQSNYTKLQNCKLTLLASDHSCTNHTL